jgi:hypothetical protein
MLVIGYTIKICFPEREANQRDANHESEHKNCENNIDHTSEPQHDDHHHDPLCNSTSNSEKLKASNDWQSRNIDVAPTMDESFYQTGLITDDFPSTTDENSSSDSSSKLSTRPARSSGELTKNATETNTSTTKSLLFTSTRHVNASTTPKTTTKSHENVTIFSSKQFTKRTSKIPNNHNSRNLNSTMKNVNGTTTSGFIITTTNASHITTAKNSNISTTRRMAQANGATNMTKSHLNTTRSLLQSTTRKMATSSFHQVNSSTMTSGRMNGSTVSVKSTMESHSNSTTKDNSSHSSLLTTLRGGMTSRSVNGSSTTGSNFSSSSTTTGSSSTSAGFSPLTTISSLNSTELTTLEPTSDSSKSITEETTTNHTSSSDDSTTIEGSNHSTTSHAQNSSPHNNHLSLTTAASGALELSVTEPSNESTTTNSEPSSSLEPTTNLQFISDLQSTSDHPTTSSDHPQSTTKRPTQKPWHRKTHPHTPQPSPPTTEYRTIKRDWSIFFPSAGKTEIMTPRPYFAIPRFTAQNGHSLVFNTKNHNEVEELKVTTGEAQKEDQAQAPRGFKFQG